MAFDRFLIPKKITVTKHQFIENVLVGYTCMRPYKETILAQKNIDTFKSRMDFFF